MATLKIYNKRYSDSELLAVIRLIEESNYHESNHLGLLKRLIKISKEENITLLSAASGYGLGDVEMETEE